MGRRGLTESVIPDGLYCYTPKGIEYRDDGMPIFKVEKCPYWQHTNREDGGYDAYCEYLEASDDVLLWDQVKICGVRDDFDPDEHVWGTSDEG